MAKFFTIVVVFIIYIIFSFLGVMYLFDGWKDLYKLNNWDKSVGSYQKTEMGSYYSKGRDSFHYIYYYLFDANGTYFRCRTYGNTPEPLNLEEEILFNPQNPEESMLLSQIQKDEKFKTAIMYLGFPIIVTICVATFIKKRERKSNLKSKEHIERI